MLPRVRFCFVILGATNGSYRPTSMNLYFGAQCDVRDEASHTSEVHVVCSVYARVGTKLSRNLFPDSCALGCNSKYVSHTHTLCRRGWLSMSYQLGRIMLPYERSYLIISTLQPAFTGIRKPSISYHVRGRPAMWTTAVKHGNFDFVTLHDTLPYSPTSLPYQFTSIKDSILRQLTSPKP